MPEPEQKSNLNKIQLIVEELSSKEILTTCISINKDIMNDKEIRFLNFSIEDIKIKADKRKLLEVFGTLVQCSHDFVGSFGRIEIGVINGKDEVTFFVEDNGDGISKEKQDQLFKIDDTFSGSSSLVASRNLVEAMGGKMWIESKSYLGTKFLFTLPKS